MCRFEGYENERSLALHRFITVETSSLIFSRPAGFDLIEYDNDGRFGFGDGKRVKISFCIIKVAGFHLTEAPLALDQQVKEMDDHYRITVTVLDSAMLDRWLLGFGGDVWGVEKSNLDELASKNSHA